MKEKNKVGRNLLKIDDCHPPVLNCRGERGTITSPRGRLTNREVSDIKSLPIVTDLGKQPAVPKKCRCPTRGETEIAYYPIILSICEGNPIIAIQALCLNIACEHNLGSPIKKPV